MYCIFMKMIFRGSKLNQDTRMYLYFNIREYLKKCNFYQILRFFTHPFTYFDQNTIHVDENTIHMRRLFFGPLRGQSGVVDIPYFKLSLN